MKSAVANNLDFIEKLVKPEILSLQRFQEKQPDRYDYLRLDRKERLIPFDQKLFKKFIQSIKFEEISGYYELDNTYRKLAKFLGVAENQIFLTAGSDLGVRSIYESTVLPADNVVLHSPSYAMFRVYAKMYGAEARMVPLTEDWQIDVQGMLNCVDDKTKLVAVENPNGFVGTSPDEKTIEFLAAELHSRGILLVLDEAYYFLENAKCRSQRLIEKYPNVLISQTFSKAHGLAGLRFGYLIGHPKLIEYISRVKPLHEVSSLAAKAAEWVIDHPQLLAENRVSIKESKGYLIKELKKIGVNVRDSHASFVLAYLPNEGKTKNIAEKLKEKKILIRRPFEENFLKGWLLICVGTLEHSKYFLKCLKEILRRN